MASFTPNFTINDIENDFKQFIDGIISDGVEAGCKTLKKIVDKARARTKSENGFGNITWNLRASIGGVVVSDHQIVFTYFPKISQAPEGNTKGPAYARELASLVDDGGIIIILVAGMDYASFVEAKGYDVITHSSKAFEGEFLSLIKSK